MNYNTKEEIKQKQYYDSIANEYEFHYNDENALKYRNRLFENFLKQIDLKNSLVLDAMCGGGQNASFFLNKKAIFIGVDISEGQIQNFKKRFPFCEVYCDSILNFNEKLGQYDFIIADSLHHLHPNVNDCMNKFHQLLKTDGYLMLWEPSSGSIFDLLRKLWYKTDKKYFEDNEASIDLKRLTHNNIFKFKLVKYNYGGNFAYILLFLTMAFRNKKIKNPYVVNIIIQIEFILNYIQNKYFSLWFLALYQKK